MNAYKIKICKRENGCRNAVYNEIKIVDEIVSMFECMNYTGFIKGEIQGSVKSHHQFKVTISCCPNSCPMPQIVDVGLVAATPVMVSNEPCSNCKSCLETCLEDAIILDEIVGPKILHDRCVYCAKCAGNCPTGTITTKEAGFRIMVGGKLGRHARLALELPGIFPKEKALLVLQNSINLFIENYSRVNRFGDLFSIYNENMVLKKISS